MIIIILQNEMQDWTVYVFEPINKRTEQRGYDTIRNEIANLIESLIMLQFITRISLSS